MKNIKCAALYTSVITGLLLFLVRLPLLAQDTTLSRDQLKAYEGIFQSQQNNDMKVQFKADSNSLQAKLLWNGGQIRLYPKSSVDFYSKEGETVNLKFVKGADGQFNQLSIGTNGLWDRIRNYKAIVKKEFPHTPDQLHPFTGLYQFQGDSNRYIQLSESSNQLILKQHWDGQEVALVPDSTWDFFNKDQQMFTLHFNKGNDGAIKSVLAFRRDLWNKVPPIRYTLGQLQAFEGKYRLKDDKDDIIQIRASGDNLIVKQLWDGKETILTPLAESYFYNRAEGYPAKFLKDSSGAITTALMLTGDEFEKITD